MLLKDQLKLLLLLLLLFSRPCDIILGLFVYIYKIPLSPLSSEL